MDNLPGNLLQHISLIALKKQRRGMMKKVVGAVAVLVASMMSTTAVADNFKKEERPKQYVQGQLGFFGQGDDLDNHDYDEGFNSSLAYGRYIAPNVILEGMVDYFIVDSEVDGSNEVQGRYSRENTLSVAGYLLTLKAEYPVGDFDIFGGVGVGVYSVLLDTEIESNRIGDSHSDEYDTTLGAHLSVGVNYNLNRNVFIGIEGRCRWTGDIDIDETVASVPQEYEGNLNGYSVVAAAGIRF